MKSNEIGTYQMGVPIYESKIAQISTKNQDASMMSSRSADPMRWIP